jgi:Dolichyl-phosphate-mannose-protein mannosyltransferase
MARLDRLSAPALFWCLLPTLLVLTATHVYRSLDALRDGYEGAMMLVSERMTEGLPSREWLAKVPYTVSPYGPAYFALARFASFVGRQPRSLVPGRLVSVIAGLLTAGLIGLVVGRRTSSSALGLASAVVYLGYPGVDTWIHQYRIDALAVLFAIAATATAGLSRRRLAVSALMVVAGSLVKQSVGLAAVPVVLYLWIEGRHRDAGLYVLSVLALAGMVWAILFYASGGYYFDLGVLGNRRPYYPSQAIYYGGWFARRSITVAAFVSLLAAAVVNPAAVIRCRFAIAAVVAGALAVVLSGFEGATTNYYLETAALASILLGIHGLGALWRISRAWTAVFLLFACIAIGAREASRAWNQTNLQPRSPALAAALAGVTSDYVLADAPCVALVSSLGLVPAVNDPFFYRVLVRNRLLDPRQLAADMRAGRVGALVLSRPLETYTEDGKGWPAEIVAVMSSHFASAGFQQAQFYVYIHHR